GGPDGAPGPGGARPSPGARDLSRCARPDPRQPGAGSGVRRPARLRRPGAPGRPAEPDGARADAARLAAPADRPPDRRAADPAPRRAAAAPLLAGVPGRAPAPRAVRSGDRAATGPRAREAARRPGGPRRHEPVQRHEDAEARFVPPHDPDLRAL